MNFVCGENFLSGVTGSPGSRSQNIPTLCAARELIEILQKRVNVPIFARPYKLAPVVAVAPPFILFCRRRAPCATKLFFAPQVS
jgi:hypothetical protein